jgi:hypothetical protein
MCVHMCVVCLHLLVCNDVICVFGVGAERMKNIRECKSIDE